ncbi:MAG: hypothetical protein P8M30_02660 [Planctomycetaceae bacterium]|jgi:hypothetical protein|nr:hypothetical protein [bacterium]MDC0273684.1 hypothetical protein [Planctomycetaceae bacterium]MDG2388199.1 hypothetical protein [Planctomycetaceae bacterium]
MFKMLFLPRGYFTIVALFWAYDYGLFDSISQSPDYPTGTSMTEWLKPGDTPKDEMTAAIDLMPPAEFASLKDEILKELSALDQQLADNSQTSLVQSQTSSRREDQGQRRSEVPRDIKIYLHKLFR